MHSRLLDSRCYCVNTVDMELVLVFMSVCEHSRYGASPGVHVCV